MSYKYSTGSLRQGDLYFEDDRAGEPTYIDWGQDTITLRPSGSAILYAEAAKVGIGTTSPDYTLHVAGDMGVNEYLYHNGDTDTFMRFEDDEVNIEVGGRQMIKMVEASTDKITFNNGGMDVDLQIKGENDANLIRTIASTDRVGIGVNDPDTKLEVAGAVHLSGEVATPSAPSDTDGGILYVKTDGKIYWISNEVSETDLTSGGGGSGETNTASNLGDSDDGEGLFSAKSGVDLEFKRIKAGVASALTSETNDVLIDSLTRIKQEGCKFSYTDASTITLTPNGLDSKATVGILSGSTFSAVELSGDLTCDLSTSGAGGLDTGAEANSTGYYVFVITQAAGASPALLCSTSDTTPTMPTDYVYQSEPIWFISNDSSGDILDFVAINGRCFYREPPAALASGLNYSGWDAIDCSVLAPNNSTAFVLGSVRASSTTVWNNVFLALGNTGATASSVWSARWWNAIRNANGASSREHMSFNWPLVNAATSMYYIWGSNPGSGGSYPPGFNIHIRGWTLL